MVDDVGELFTEGSGYFFVFGEDAGVEGDGLVGRGGGTIVGKGFYDAVELCGVVFVRARLECVDPCLIVGVSDLLC